MNYLGLLKITKNYDVDASDLIISALGGFDFITRFYGASHLMKFSKGLGLSFEISKNYNSSINHIAIKYNSDGTFQLELNYMGSLDDDKSIHIKGIRSVSKFQGVGYSSLRKIINKELGIIVGV